MPRAETGLAYSIKSTIYKVKGAGLSYSIKYKVPYEAKEADLAYSINYKV